MYLFKMIYFVSLLTITIKQF